MVLERFSKMLLLSLVVSGGKIAAVLMLSGEVAILGLRLLNQVALPRSRLGQSSKC